ncbi:MAG: glycosyltransferase family 39 protein [Candidatus Zixiibacteriota bacterium]
MKTTADRNKKSLITLTVIIIAALVLRVYYIFQYAALPDWDQLTIDNYYHHHWAQTIANGHIFGDTTYFRAPFYIYCLGFLYALFGFSYWVGRLFGIAIGLASILMTYMTGRRLFNPRLGLIAAAIQTVYPVIIFFESELLLDPLFMLLLQFAVYRFLVWRDRPEYRQIFICGLLFGLAAITRPTALALAGVIILLVLFKDKKIVRENLKTAVLFVVGLFLIISPIFVRNLAVARDPVLIASQGGINLYIGNNDTADGSSAALPEPLGLNWHIQDITWLAEQDLQRELKPGEVSSYWTGKAINWIRAHPGSFIKLYLKKIYFSFISLELSNNRDIYEFFSKFGILKYNPLSFGLIFPLAFWGLALTFKSNRNLRLLILLMAVYIVVSALFFVNSRFRLPLMPYFIIFAACLPVFIREVFRVRFKRLLVFTAAGVLLAVLSFYIFVPLNRKGFTQTMVSKGLYYIHVKDYNRAAAYLHEALRLERDFIETNLNLGICFFRMGITDSARYYFEQEKLYFPDRPKAYNNLASLYLVSGEPDKALAEIEHSLALKPFDPIANMIYLRAVALKEDVSDDRLNDLINQAALRTHQDLYLLNEAAALMLHRQDFDRAITLLQRAGQAVPPPIETDDYAFSKDFRNSPADFAREKAGTFHQLGYLYGIKGDFAESIASSRRAVELNPELSDAYVNLVSGYLSLGDRQTADSVYQKARRKFPDDEQVLRLKLLLEPKKTGP